MELKMEDEKDYGESEASGCENEGESVTTDQDDQLSIDTFSMKTYDNRKFDKINDLNLKSCNWTIRAGITSKSRIVRPNEEHTKTFFNIDLEDESGEIRAYAFKDDLDTEFYTLFNAFQERNIYLFSNLKVEETCSKEPIKHDFQLVFHAAPQFNPCEEKINIKYDIVPIVEVQSMTKGDYVDIIGVCINAGHVVEIEEKGVPEITRNIELSDIPGKTVTVHLRGEEAVRFDGKEKPIVAIKRGYVTIFDDENRIIADSYNISPDIKEARDLSKMRIKLCSAEYHNL